MFRYQLLFEYLNIQILLLIFVHKLVQQDLQNYNLQTFYLHYENTADLLKETTQYITDSFLTYFSVDTKSIAYKYNNCELKDLVFITPQYLIPYLTYIKENQKVFKTAIKHLGTMDFQKVYDKMFKFIFNPVLERFSFPEREREYVLKFYLTGITAIVMEWPKNDCEESMDDISRIIIQCVMGQNKV